MRFLIYSQRSVFFPDTLYILLKLDPHARVDTES